MKKKWSVVLFAWVMFLFMALPAFSVRAGAEETAASGDYSLAFRKHFVGETYAGRNTDEQILSDEYKSMLSDLIKLFCPEKLEEFSANVSELSKPMTRGEGIVMSWYAAVCIGADNYNFGPFSDQNPRMSEDFWDMGDSALEELFPGINAQHAVQADQGFTWDNDFVAAMIWNCWHCSFSSSMQVVAFDEAAGRMRNGDPFSMEDAICAAARLGDSIVVSRLVPIGDAQAVTPSISRETLEQARASSVSHIDDLPRLTGFVLMDEYGYDHYTIDIKPNDIKEIAAWGFNSIRLAFTYETLFSADCTQANLTQFEILDELIETAMRNGIHTDLLLLTLPGRTTWYRHNDTGIVTESGGDFDLFINQDKMDQACAIWRIIAARYKAVPGSALSFTPCWEAMNFSLSTGVPCPEYNAVDVARGLDAMIGAIRSEDSGRFLFYEPTPVSLYTLLTEEAEPSRTLLESKYDNIRFSANFCEGAYAFSEMTADEGANVDMNNHSLYKSEYPVTIWAAAGAIYDSHGLTMDGFLPAGTRIDIHVGRTRDHGTFTVSDENGILYSEKMADCTYTTSLVTSRYYPFASSEKIISITLEKKTEQLFFTCKASALEWSGITVTLPEEFAVRRRYYRSEWDMIHGLEEGVGPEMRTTSEIIICPNNHEEGRHLTIHDDVTYSSEAVWEAANRDTIEAWGSTVSRFSSRCLIRFEDAMFYLGTDQDSMLRYYDDLLTMCDEYGFDWYSNDYHVQSFTNPNLGADLIPYGPYKAFNLELLQLLQKHQ